MHPIERLRHVARAQDVDQRLLAREAAVVLGTLADDPLGLVTSCRRLLDRHPGAGALWWVCARLLDAADPGAEARAVGRDLADDAVGRALALDLPERATVVVVPDPAGGSVLTDHLAVTRDDLVPVEAEDPGLDVAAVLEAGASLAESTGLTGAPGADGSTAPAGVGPGASDPGPGAGPTLMLVEAGAAGPDDLLVAPGTADGMVAARGRGVPVWAVVGVGHRLPGPLFAAVARKAPGADVLAAARVDRLVEPRRLSCPCPPELARA